MLKYIEGFHENGMTISVLEGNELTDWAKEHGFFQAEVEEAWDGTLWKTGTAPKNPPLEYIEEHERTKRNQLLSETDVYMIVDYPISEANLQKMKKYRQALRDLPAQPGWPRNIVWPEKPSI